MTNTMIYTTVGEYRDSHAECTGEFFGQDGELLESDAPITIDVMHDQWCAGHYDGNSTWEPLGSDYSACDFDCSPPSPRRSP